MTVSVNRLIKINRKREFFLNKTICQVKFITRIIGQKKDKQNKSLKHVHMHTHIWKRKMGSIRLYDEEAYGVLKHVKSNQNEVKSFWLFYQEKPLSKTLDNIFYSHEW